MNSNHAGHGHFCTREEARLCSPLLADTMEDFQTGLYVQAKKILRAHASVIRAGGKCVALLYPNGDIEFVVLSAESYEAYRGKAEAGKAFNKRRGKVGGVQDGHNIRRGVRRWIQRNSDVIGDENVCLCVIRDEEDILRLSAVWVA